MDRRQVKIIGAETVVIPLERFLEAARNLMGERAALGFDMGLRRDRFVEYEMFQQPIRVEMVPVVVYDVVRLHSSASFMSKELTEEHFCERDVLLSEVIYNQDDYCGGDDPQIVSDHIRAIVDLKPGQEYNINKLYIRCKEI